MDCDLIIFLRVYHLHRVVTLCYSKILDPDMSPLGFDAKKLYHFVAVRFKKTSAKVQEQALNWLQVRKVATYLCGIYIIYKERA
jgi:hypothetical protein